MLTTEEKLRATTVQFHRLREENEKLQAENGRLRFALQALADENWLDPDPTDTPFLALAKDHARRALES